MEASDGKQTLSEGEIYPNAIPSPQEMEVSNGCEDWLHRLLDIQIFRAELKGIVGCKQNVVGSFSEVPSHCP